MLFDMETIRLFKSVIGKSKYLNLPADGTSMFPLIQEGDVCRFCECDPLQLKKGDIVLFCTSTGQLIAHRFYESKVVDHETLYFFKGDTNLGIDQPVVQEQIIGKLLYIQKETTILYASHLLVSIWGNFIIHFPITSGILRRYINHKYRITYR